MQDTKSLDMVLLYVEDDDWSRQHISQQLSLRYPGLRVLEASDGAEGLAIFKAEHPDLILTDLLMPHMDGIAMSRQIKALDADAVIVALTAFSDTDNLLKAIDVGINGYLLKPISYEKLFILLDRKFSYLALKKALNEQNEYIRKLSFAVEHSPVSVVIANRDGVIEYVNLKFQELTGYALDEVIGQNVNVQKSGQTPRETYEVLWRTITAGQVWQGEFLNKKKNGDLYWERASIAPILDDAGAITHYIAIKEDITEHRRMVQALEKSQRRFATLFGAVPALIVISTVGECTVLEANESFLQATQYQPEDVVGRSLTDLAVWETETEREKLAAKLRVQGELKNQEIRVKTKYGHALVGLLSTATFELEDHTFMMSVIRDITDRKDREAEIERLNARLATRAAELENANKELEAFNSMIAHDLRNPLNVINSYSQVVSELCGERLDPTCRKYLKETYNGTLRMNELIDALLDFSRLSHTEPSREPVDLSSLAEEVAGELRHLLPECDGTLEVTPGITANCDRFLVRIVLQNLLGNAMKYNCNRADLRISFGVDEGRVKPVYFVRDNGIGFNPSDTEKIFQPFQRLAGPEEVRGHGIGLATVERIVRRHGGVVWAEGEEGKGATIYFTLEPEGGLAPG